MYMIFASEKFFLLILPKYFAGLNYCRTFVAPVPAKPLYNAQIGGSFYIYFMKVDYTKTCLPLQDLIILLKKRGLAITDEQKAIGYLANIGYSLSSGMDGCRDNSFRYAVQYF